MPSDSLESLSSDMTSDQRISTEVIESSSSKPSEIMPSTLPQKQAPKRWQPGQSGNPAGRPKGAKNQVTILKQTLELQLREKAKSEMPKVLKKAIELALAGDRMMIKLLLELHMSRASHQEDESGGKSQVAVVIQNLTDPPKQSIVVEGRLEDL